MLTPANLETIATIGDEITDSTLRTEFNAAIIQLEKRVCEHPLSCTQELVSNAVLRLDNAKNNLKAILKKAYTPDTGHRLSPEQEKAIDEQATRNAQSIFDIYMQAAKIDTSTTGNGLYSKIFERRALDPDPVRHCKPYSGLPTSSSDSSESAGPSGGASR